MRQVYSLYWNLYDPSIKLVANLLKTIHIREVLIQGESYCLVSLPSSRIFDIKINISLYIKVPSIYPPNTACNLFWIGWIWLNIVITYGAHMKSSIRKQKPLMDELLCGQNFEASHCLNFSLTILLRGWSKRLRIQNYPLISKDHKASGKGHV
jgi:hypothetical protein